MAAQCRSRSSNTPETMRTAHELRIHELCGLKPGDPEWRRLRVMINRPLWKRGFPRIFLMCWRDVVEESRAAARRCDSLETADFRPWNVIINGLPTMKGRALITSLGPILNLSATCICLRRRCCREMKRWWAQIRTAVINEEVNGKYLDGLPFANLVRLASSIARGFRPAAISQAAHYGSMWRPETPDVCLHDPVLACVVPASGNFQSSALWFDIASGNA